MTPRISLAWDASWRTIGETAFLSPLPSFRGTLIKASPLSRPVVREGGVVVPRQSHVVCLKV